MKKVLITGITGFVGKYLTEYLLSSNKYQISGVYRSEESLSRLGKIKESIRLEKVDILDGDAVSSLILSLEPDYIIHLAAMTSPAESFKAPGETLMTNIMPELNILETLRNNNLKNVRVIIVSTADVYGKVDPSELPEDEDTRLHPVNPYAVSKIAQDFLGLQYFLSFKLDIVRVRPFNHTGPGQSEYFVIPSFAKQIATIERGAQEPVLYVGNLNTKRDFTDVRDIVKAYALLLEKGVSGDVYNLGSGKSYQIKGLLEKLIGFSSKKIEVREDPEKIRPVDIMEVLCDYSKLHSVTGWKAEIPIEKSLQDILDYWRNIV